MIKKCYRKILLVILLLANNMCAKPQLIDWKMLSDTSLNGAELFIDRDNRILVEAAYHYLWINGNQVKTDQYGQYSSGFVKDGKVYLIFNIINEPYIDIYSVGKDITFEERIKMEDYPLTTDVVYVPGGKNALYLLGYRRQTSSNPAEALRFWMSGGHGILYDKPLLAKIEGQRLLGYEMLRYGGKRNESYRIREVLTGEDTIHLVGFRTPAQLPYTPAILCYTEYDTKKKKVVRTQNIYEKEPDFNKNDGPRNLYLEWSSYWHVSADRFNNDLFIIFSWHRFRFSANVNKVPQRNMENVDSPIYYTQSNKDGFGDIEIIGKGILPLVRADSVGNVHVIWTDSNGNIVHKVKKDGKWSNEQIVMVNVIDTNEIWTYTRQQQDLLQKMCAEFDNDNNLNLVFTSKGKLVYAKIK